MIKLPSWVRPLVKNSTCNSCKKQRELTEVVGMGLRQKVVNRKEQFYFFFEAECNKCGKITYAYVEKVPVKPLRFADELKALYGGGSNKATARPILPDKTISSITDKEVSDFKIKLNACENYDDVLGLIGAKSKKRKKSE
jgi:hypothetical protein